MKKALLVLVLVLLIVCNFAFAKDEKKKNKQRIAIKQEEQANDVVEQKHHEKRDPSCPNQCGNHGTCNNGICTCDKHWSGVDCSYADEELTNGVPMQGTITLGRWQYYHINLQSSSNMDIWVNESSRWSDCDVYVQRNAYPTRSVYAASSTTSQSNSHIAINGAQFGNWIIGIYGFSFTRCSFTIQVNLSSVCNSNCSGHGSCLAGECACDAGWTGSDCSKIKSTLDSGATTPSISIAKWQWLYFVVNITAPAPYLKITVQSLSGDPDLYVKRGRTPSTFSWDALNVTTSSVATVTIQTPAIDLYYIGVFGFQAATFTVTAEFPIGGQTLTCPSKCSSHGTCNSDGTCQCNVGYNGLKCQNGTTGLVMGSTVQGYVAQNDWNNYWFQFSTSNPVQIHVEQSEASDDCDVYVKKATPPTRFSFDAYSISAQQTFDVYIPNPGTPNWYIGVFGWKNCTYNLKLSMAVCDCGSASHGSCTPASGSRCVCSDGYTGVDCTYQLNTVNSGADGLLHLAAINEWVYYSFTTTSSNVAIVMRETASSGYFWLYVAENPPSASIAPTLETHTYSETGTGALHSIFITRESADRITYVIGVYGNPYNPTGLPMPFEVAAFGTSF